MIAGNVLSAAKALAEIFPESKSLAIATGCKVINRDTNIEVIEDLKSAEQYLREVGMSRTEAKAFIARVKSLGPRDAGEDEMQSLIAALKQRKVPA